jgi:hypothetical protein
MEQITERLKTLKKMASDLELDARPESFRQVLRELIDVVEALNSELEFAPRKTSDR